MRETDYYINLTLTVFILSSFPPHISVFTIQMLYLTQNTPLPFQTDLCAFNSEMK